MRCRYFTQVAVWIFVAMDAAGAVERATAKGKVLGSDGTPIEHATVLVYEAWTKHGYSLYCPTCWVDCGKRAVTSADGRYSIPGLNPDLVFKLLVVRNGYKTVLIDKVDPAKGSAADAVLRPAVATAEPSQTIRGRVVDSHGNVLRDVVVEQNGVVFNGPRGRGRSFGPNDSPEWIQPLSATDERGEFQVIYAKPAIEITLSVSPRGMAPKLVTLPTGGEKKTITVTQGATLRGRLLQPDGTPAKNAEIGVSVHSRMAGTVFPEVLIGTRDDGTFAITNIPAGRVWYVYPKMESLAGG
jgi:hypothetical protein